MYRCHLVISLWSLLAVWGVDGYGHYRTRLPNGERVGHPCKPNFIWKGVGHKNVKGGGPRNSFGLDFAANNHHWTPELCRLDSDEDGVSNGVELGDPDCEWTPGTLPNRTTDITHPGVCTPFGSAGCQGKNDWVDCTGAVLECPALENPDTLNVTLQFPRTAVPAKETTYMCMVFDMPSDVDHHLIGYKPYIDNDNVMHHILIYGCDDSDAPLPTAPYECGMNAANSCTTMIGAWTLGEAGDCLDERFGLLFGKSRYSRFALEFHWNNPSERSGWFDASGMVVYYTTQLRPNNGAVLSVGQTYLEIPPGKEATTFTSRCSSTCTNAALTGSIFISGGTNHMHYLGTAQSVELIRDGTRLRYITNDPVFSYDDPKFYEFDPPIEVKPGDELLTTCTYKSTNSRKTVYYGDATSDEMCYGYLWFYPSEAMSEPYCDTYKSVEICAVKTRSVVMAGCNALDFVDGKSNDSMMIYDDIDVSCTSWTSCSESCRTAVKKAMGHPCLKGGDITDYVNSLLNTTQLGRDFLKTLDLCTPTKTSTNTAYTRTARDTGISLVVALMLLVLEDA
ncbi:dopamine beta-hydroxylase-like [Haliotis cracherodii]|uniref:dopamine beta-hydroxylase-like n=1 Tax=Haliotis cracherodii TaxID=6455 RepID=UPI0039EC8B99